MRVFKSLALLCHCAKIFHPDIGAKETSLFFITNNVDSSLNVRELIH